MKDCNGVEIEVGQMVEVEEHDGVPACIGEVDSITVNDTESYVTVKYDTMETGLEAWDCDPKFVLVRTEEY